MLKNYFQVRSAGLPGELLSLSPEAAKVHFENYRHCFFLDRTVAVCYCNRFVHALSAEHRAFAESLVAYLLDKSLQFQPFGLVQLPKSFFMSDPKLRCKAEILEKTHVETEELQRIAKMDFGRDAGAVVPALRRLLAVHPDDAQIAELLLAANFSLGRSPDWLDDFVCPEPLRDDFNGMLFRHAAAIGDVEHAVMRWGLLPKEARREVNLNFMAEAARMQGDAGTAKACYARSLALDPSQSAARFRLLELESPSRKDPTLPERKKVAIYLYSYNKAKMLGETLGSLAASNIGRASITILLNGCSDASRAVVEQARKKFPGNAYTVIPLSVNIGAPAARNWLINRPETWQAEYVAFLDDDVQIPADWLEWFLSVAERDPKTGVVGCKVLFPGRPNMLQYLYRYVSVASPDLLSLSLSTPDHQYDNGCYDFVREARSVMGCLHLFRTAALRDVPNFDIRFSPSQMDDIDHDLNLCLAGWKVMYCGLVACVHKQSSGVGVRTEGRALERQGNVIGNDIKFFYKHIRELNRLRRLDNLSLLPWVRRAAGRA